MSKPVVIGQPQSQYGQDQEVWLRENTLSTSLMISTMVFCINFKFRNIQDRNVACDGFLQLFNMLVSALGNIRMDIVPHGSEDNQLVTLHVDGTGHLDGQQFWSERFYVKYVGRSWNQDVQNEQKKWLKSSHGLGRVHLVELICFSLDPQHNEFLKGTLLPECWNMLSQFARLLDDSIEFYRCGMDPLSFGEQLKNFQRVSRAVKSVWLEALARMVWSGEDTFFPKFMHVVYQFCIFLLRLIKVSMKKYSTITNNMKSYMKKRPLMTIRSWTYKFMSWGEWHILNFQELLISDAIRNMKKSLRHLVRPGNVSNVAMVSNSVLILLIMKS